MLPLRARVDLGVMTMKGYSVFRKVPALLEPHHQIVLCHIRTLGGGVISLCRGVVVYFTAPAKWAISILRYRSKVNKAIQGKV